MKKNYLHYYLPFILILLIVSSGCRKADTTIDNISKIDNSIVISAKQFLLSQKNNSNYTEQQSVDTLLIKSNWDNGIMYNINTAKALLYFPSFINENISLVFAYDKLSNKIDSGNLILLNKSITESEASSQIIFSILRNTMSNYSGSVSTYTLNNKFKQEDGFKTGKKIYQKKLISLKANSTQAKIKMNGVVKTNGDSDCIAWFWVMTYEDGSQTWSYLYTQCGLCEPNFAVELTSGIKMIKTNCGGGGGGGNAIIDDLNVDFSQLISILFKFPMDSDYESKYPKFYSLVKNIYSTALTNPRILDGLKSYSHMSNAELYSALKWGSGPTVKASDINTNYNGPHRFGYFNGAESKTIINIEIADILQFELSAANSSQNAAWQFLLMVALLHETVHFGNTQVGFIEKYEFGDGWEVYVYGERIDNYEVANKIIIQKQ
ncbi:MAG: hypothetical protein V4450_06855 [Bacteroidota bacterium]